MASVTLTTPSLLTSLAASDLPTTTRGRSRLVVVKAISSAQGAAVKQVEIKKESNGRRDLMFAAAAAAACSIAGAAFADEPARGTPEAKKAYAPVCVTMPTARICHK